MCDFDTPLSGLLPNAGTLCILRNNIIDTTSWSEGDEEEKTQSYGEDGQDHSEEEHEEEAGAEETPASGTTAGPAVVPPGAPFRYCIPNGTRAVQDQYYRQRRRNSRFKCSGTTAAEAVLPLRPRTPGEQELPPEAEAPEASAAAVLPLDERYYRYNTRSGTTARSSVLPLRTQENGKKLLQPLPTTTSCPRL